MVMSSGESYYDLIAISPPRWCVFITIAAAFATKTNHPWSKMKMKKALSSKYNYNVEGMIANEWERERCLYTLFDSMFDHVYVITAE